jgi:hypothetical protein
MPDLIRDAGPRHPFDASRKNPIGLMLLQFYTGPRLGGRGDDELECLYEIIPDSSGLGGRDDPLNFLT